MNTPILLNKKILLKRLIEAKGKLQELKNELPDNSNLLHGIFLLAFSLFESSINDSFIYFLSWFPDKFKKHIKGLKFLDISDLPRNIICDLSESYVQDQTYLDLKTYLDLYSENLSIPLPASNLIDQILEIKATRNILIHGNLTINNKYLTITNIPRGEKGDKVKVDSQYISDSLDHLTKFLDEIINEISNKFNTYTKVRSIRELWNYYFKNNHIAEKFDDMWEINVTEDTISSFKIHESEGAFSHTEKIKLALWRQLYNNYKDEYLLNFSMSRFDKENQKRILYLLSIADEFSLY
jgi:hypothetical protein